MHNLHNSQYSLLKLSSFSKITFKQEYALLNSVKRGINNREYGIGNQRFIQWNKEIVGEHRVLNMRMNLAHT